MNRLLYLKFLLFFSLFLFFRPIHAYSTSVDSCFYIMDDYNSKDTLILEYASLLEEVGACFAEGEYYIDALAYFKRSIHIAKTIDHPLLILKNLINLGGAYFWISEYEKGLKVLDEALENYATILTDKEAAKIYITKGNLYYYLDKKHLSYQNTLKALELSGDQSDPQVIGDSYYALAKMDVDQKKYETGLEKIMKASEIYQSLNNTEDVAYCYDVMADIYHETGQYQLALKYVELSCEMDSEDEYEQYYAAYCAHFYAKIYESMGEYQQALSYYEEAISTMKNSNQYGEIVQTKADMAKLLAIMGNCTKSMQILKDCVQKAKTRKNRPTLRDIYHNLFEANNVCGQYKTAIVYLEQYNSLKDSLLYEANLEEVGILSANNELQQQKQELALLQKDKTLQSLYNYLMGTAIVVLFLFIFIGAWAFKQQQQQNKLLAEQNQTIEHQNEQLKTTNDDLKIANKDLRQFAYVVSHDLKAPLRGISTLASFIEEDLRSEMSPSIKNDIITNLDLLKGRIFRMNNLISGILAYAQIGKTQELGGIIDLNELLPQIIQFIAPPKTIRIELSTSLPSLMASRIAIQQVFQNLISNAIKYNDKSLGLITINYQDLGDFHQFEIKDNGPGIPAKYHQKIFQIFQTLQARDEVEATGIGLSIVEKIVKEQGNGQIWVDSIVGEGASFVFTWLKNVNN